MYHRKVNTTEAFTLNSTEEICLILSSGSFNGELLKLSIDCNVGKIGWGTMGGSGNDVSNCSNRWFYIIHAEGLLTSSCQTYKCTFLYHKMLESDLQFKYFTHLLWQMPFLPGVLNVLSYISQIKPAFGHVFIQQINSFEININEFRNCIWPPSEWLRQIILLHHWEAMVENEAYGLREMLSPPILTHSEEYPLIYYT